MKPKYKLILMGFDGDYQIERPEFNAIEEAWEYHSNLGSKWVFYPFPFICTESLKTIKSSFDGFSEVNGRKLKTVKEMFSKLSVEIERDFPEEKFNCDDWVYMLKDRFWLTTSK